MRSVGGAEKQELLRVRGLKVAFGGGPNIVDGVDLDLARGRILCLVGESGSGKSLTALSLIKLLPPQARVSAEDLLFEDIDLLGLSERTMTALRGDRLAMVFQEPMTSLNPVMTIGDQIVEALRQHRSISRAEARRTALGMLKRVQMPAAEERMTVYPHQLSGGMRQRVMIAIALVCRPSLLIADEPTTALDVTIESQILALVDELRSELGTAVLFITHNLAVVAEIADEIAVMYAGRVVERGSRDDLFADPQHPYTLSLFAAMPRADDVGRKLASIEGQVPSADAMPPGCRFAPRCPFVIRQCEDDYPPMREMSEGHEVACWRAPLEWSFGAEASP